MNNGREKDLREFLLPAAAFLIVAFLFFFRLGSYPLINPDEGRNAQIAFEMHNSGSWLIPTLNGHPYLDKPAFYFRMVALSIAAFGKNETAARLPSALFAFALCVLIYVFCMRVYGKRLAALSVIVFASIPLTIAFARIVIFDMPLAFFTTASILTSFLAEESVARERRIYYIISAAAAGFATLVKGPVGFIVPALVVFIFHITQRNRRAILRAMHPLNIAVFFAIVLPWFIGVCIRQPDFIHYGLVEETLNRYTTTSFGRSGPIWYYAPVLAGVFFPYSLLLPGAILSAVRLRQSLCPADRLLMVWIIVVIVFFSTSHSKLPGYILSAMVPLGILIARLFERAFERPEGRSGRMIMAGITAVSLLSAALTSLLLYDYFHPKTIATLFHIRSAEYERLQPNLFSLIPALAVIFATGALARIFRRIRLALIAFLIFPLALLTMSFGTLARYADAGSSRGLAAALSRLPQNTEIVCLKAFPLGLQFYLERQMVLISANGDELKSNYVTYSLNKKQAWPSGFVRVSDLDHWLLGRLRLVSSRESQRLMQGSPVFMLTRKENRTILNDIAVLRGAFVSEVYPGWWGTLLSGAKQ